MGGQYDGQVSPVITFFNLTADPLEYHLVGDHPGGLVQPYQDDVPVSTLDLCELVAQSQH